jgi:hypothetical protein
MIKAVVVAPPRGEAERARGPSGNITSEPRS